jgi:hypothetical protein
MNIVCNNHLLRYFKNISIFKIDLGRNMKGPVTDRRGKGETKMNIKDEFVKKYQSLNNGTIVRKYGEIGKLKFYEDSRIGRKEFHIYDGDKIYEIEATDDDLLKDASEYLTEVLQMLEDGDVDDEHDEGMIKNISYSNMPEDMIRPDMKLNPNNPSEKDKYIKDMIARRKLLNKIN